jgi:hypothetical protein
MNPFYNSKMITRELFTFYWNNEFYRKQIFNLIFTPSIKTKGSKYFLVSSMPRNKQTPRIRKKKTKTKFNLYLNLFLAVLQQTVKTPSIKSRRFPANPLRNFHRFCTYFAGIPFRNQRELLNRKLAVSELQNLLPGGRP